jgi:hypothetical protein
MQGKNTNIIIVTDILNTFIGSESQKENSAETSGIGIDQRIKDHLLHLQSRFCKYFPEAVTDRYKWIMDPFPQNYDFSLEEGNYIDIISQSP